MSDEPQAAQIRERRRLTPIWLLPAIALLIVCWLVWRTLSEAGIEVAVRFDNGRGIKVGKTEVVHNGIAIGKVIKVSPSVDLQAVDVKLEMNRQFKPLLTDKSAFWLVKPQVSFAGVSGLDTLVSGNYIAFSPSEKGEPKSQFIALTSPPPQAEESNGLSLVLRAEELSSVEEGSPVYYRRMKVGEVSGYNLSNSGEYIDVHIYIKKEFSQLIRQNTRFWNAGGIDISGSLTNLKVRTESLISIIQGGISFYTPDWEDETSHVANGAEFLLFKDYEDAEAGIPVTIEFPLEVSLGNSHMPIRFHGFEVGRITDVEVSDDLTKIVAEATVRPEVQRALVEGARFWVVEPRLSLQGVSGLDTLLGGRYIAMDFNKKDVESGRQTRIFTGLTQKPAAPETAPGLHLTLTADSLSGITIGSPILFRNITVGTVQSYQLQDSGVIIQLLIEPRYKHLLNESTRFWNASGVTVEGNLSGFKIKTATLNSLISGGIEFRTDNPKAQAAVNGASFALFKDEAASLDNRTMIDIWFETADGLRQGTQVKYRGMDVGLVEKLELDRKGKGVIAKVSLNNEQSWLANKRSRFWLVRPQLGLASTAHLETLVTGQYINVQLTGEPGKVATQFTGTLQEPDNQPLLGGLRLELISDRLGSVRRGNPVYYREIPVGKVTGYKLANPASQVVIYVNIEDRYKKLVSPASQFWNASGVDIDVSLFKGAKIRTESLEALLAGGIAFATPDIPENLVPKGHRYWLARKPQDEWLEWEPKILLEP
ncbi:hypothetical protein ACH42_04995 [Endozoicomonas sp. (ex Bugula neritina AB1)]|nr:hypothetical protein ACH42_04995 [Endozoicomonas sp. (ex Bugula neritina AB1)]